MPHTATAPQEPELILSSLPPGPAQKRLALVLVLALLFVFVSITAGLLSGFQATRRFDAFLPAYLTAMFVCDSITAILLYAQFSILRSRALLVIASGYLFTALILIPYFLSFPGAVAPMTPIGGLQTSAWLYVTWHCGFPLFVITYVLLKDRPSGKRIVEGPARFAIMRAAASTVALVALAASICAIAEPLLPAIMENPLRFGPQWPYLVGAPVALMSLTALTALWIRRRSMLDLWLMVVMFLALIEVPLSYYPAPTRFSAGWYVVRVFGFLSSSLVMIVLLYEIKALYARLLGALLAQRREREARLMTGGTIAATIAHEIRQPLTAIVTSADAGLRFLNRPVPNLEKARESLEWIVADGHRAGAVVESIRASFKSDAGNRSALDVNELIQEALALERSDLLKHRILVQAEPGAQLPVVSGNRVQLQQVLLNLIANAIDAMASREEPRVLLVKSGPHENDDVAVSVADTGSGIRSEDVERIFNPLFTTKSDGMGMGLSICRAIVEAHGGRLWYAPNTPRGAVFQFTLQRSAGS